MFDFIQDPEFLNTEGDHQHDNSVSSCSAKFEGELNVSKLQQYIRGLIGDQKTEMNLFRFPGVLAVRGMKKFVFQGVQMIFTGGFSDDGEWKDGETRECRFVFIGQELDKVGLIRGFEGARQRSSCVSKSATRSKPTWANG